MTIENETILSGAAALCLDCSRKPDWRVLQSPAGWYVGTICNCGPYSRETEYFDDENLANEALRLLSIDRNVLVTKAVMEITPDEVRGVAVIDGEGNTVAYVCAVGKNILITTRGWSELTLQHMKGIGE